jgi:hypothetical protein
MMPRSHRTLGSLLLLVAICAAVGCSRKDDAAVVRGPVQPTNNSVCPGSSEAKVVGHVTATAIVEASGLAASRRFDGAYWTHNDSGDRARVFALKGDGSLAAEVALEGVTATDFEDIAVAPCGSASCVFAADIGDNAAARSEVAVHRFEEPSALASGSVTPTTIRFHYEDKPHNAESLLADPRDGTLYVLTKEKSGPSTLFAVPSSGGVVRAVAQLSPPLGSNLFTAASVARDGSMVALRTYTHVFVYPVATGEPLATALQRPPCVVTAPDEPQGEAVSFGATSSTLRFVSEGRAVPLYEVTLSAPPSPASP